MLLGRQVSKERFGIVCSSLFARAVLTLKLAVHYSLCLAIFHCSSFVLLHSLLHFFVKGHSLLSNLGQISQDNMASSGLLFEIHPSLCANIILVVDSKHDGVVG